MKIEIKKFSGNLLATISECFDILSLLEEIEQNKNVNSLQKMRTQKYLVDHLVTKLYTLFENNRDVISFERLLHDYKIDSKEFKEKYFKLKKTFESLIKRIKNNRKKVAHNPKDHTLGFSYKELEDFSKKTGIKLADLPQEDENQYLFYSNLPRDGIIVLLQELKHLLFYEILYPEAKRIPIKDILWPKH
jgi:hypothetical protein